MKCRTIRYTAKGQVDLIEVEVGEPQDWEVQIQTLACGICAWDVHIFRNGTDWQVSPGHEGVGRVVKVGKFVSRFKEGDWVTGPGMGFTEYHNMSADSLYGVPNHKGYPEHWVVEPVSCVVTGLDHCAMKAGDRIAVLGCGYMGLMMVQGLGRSPLDMLIAIDVDDRRLELARRFGATEIINARNADIGALQKLGIDCVVDCSGNQAGLNLSSQIVRNGGRLNLFGWNHGTPSFPGDTWHLNGLTVVNSAPGSAIRNPWPAAIRLMERGILDQSSLVTHVVPLEEYPALLAKAASKEDGYIKGVVSLVPSLAGKVLSLGALGVKTREIDIRVSDGHPRPVTAE